MIDHVHITELGDAAFLVSFEQRISEDINALVHQLNHKVRMTGDSVVVFTIPAYCSLAIGFDNLKTSPAEVLHIINNALQNISPQTLTDTGQLYSIPVCFDDDFAQDRDRVSVITGRGWDEIVSAICAKKFHVFMIGFVAGFPYLGELPAELKCPRHEIPRKVVPEGSVAIAEQQCGIYPTNSPGGWNIIGKTPLPLIQTGKDDPFWLKPGDSVRFYPVELAEFEELQSSIVARKFSISDFHD